MNIPFTDPIEDAIIQWRAGEASRIDACYTIVANDCSSAEFANRSGLDADTVGKMVQAGKMYRLLVDRDEDLACDVRAVLTYSHLALVYRYVSVAGVISQEEAEEYLRLAIWDKLSTRKLDAKIRVDFQLIIEPAYVETVRKYIKQLDRDLITTPMMCGSKQAQDFAAEQVRPAAENLLDLLQTLEGMIATEEEPTEMIGV